MITDPAFPAFLFRFCPVCGAETFLPPKGKSFVCNRCGFVLYFNSAAAVAAIIINQAGEVLFTVRESDPARGFLDLPGGFVDPGETAEEALLREIGEELNLRIESYRFLASFANKYLYKGVLYHTTDLVYVCKVTGLHEARPGDDVSGFVFRDPEEVGEEEIGLDSIKAALRFYRGRRGETGSEC